MISPRFTLRQAEAPVLPVGARSIRILHISDLHLTPRRLREVGWIKSLAGHRPDFVISTGDHLAHPDAVAVALDAMSDLMHIPGAFVLGSNDYYAPTLKNPLWYLKKDDGNRSHGAELPWRELVASLTAAGWQDLDDKKVALTLGGLSIEFRGTDDAHLEMDHYEKVAGPRARESDLFIGVTHAPYRRVLDAMAHDGADLVFAGHTHGGQVRLPWPGGSKALVTNCDLPTWRARGLTRIKDEPWLHVSAGMGTSPYAPFRVACAPEATLLTLTTLIR